jgi:hypothetical protein
MHEIRACLVFGTLCKVKMTKSVTTRASAVGSSGKIISVAGKFFANPQDALQDIQLRKYESFVDHFRLKRTIGACDMHASCILSGVRFGDSFELR